VAHSTTWEKLKKMELIITEKDCDGLVLKIDWRDRLYKWKAGKPRKIWNDTIHQDLSHV